MTWFVGLVGVIFGLGLGLLLCRAASFQFVNRLTIADFINWIVVALLARLLQVEWQQRYSTTRVEKDLLIENAKDVISALKLTRGTFLDCSRRRQISRQDERKLKGRLRDLANDMHILECGVNECGGKMQTVPVQKAKEHLYRYKVVLTGGGFPTIGYDSQGILEQETVYRILIQSLLQLIIRINRT